MTKVCRKNEEIVNKTKINFEFGVKKRMNKQEAYKILGIEKGDTPKDIRRKYHLLMHKYHPDVIGQEEEKEREQLAAKLNEAFAVLRKAGFSSPKESVSDWGIRENALAYCKRKVFMEDQLFGDEITIDTGVEGRYYWEPDLESFPMFLKSLGQTVAGLLDRIHEEFVAEHGEEALDCIVDLIGTQIKVKAKLLHLLIQEFVDPFEVIKELYPYNNEKAEHLCAFRLKCVLKWNDPYASHEGVEEQRFVVHPTFSRLYALSEEQPTGQIQFEEDVLYYLVNPILTQNAATAEFVTDPALNVGRKKMPYVKGRLELLVDYHSKKDMTNLINKEIAAMLEKYRKFLVKKSDL